jgi:hypothetical protein
VALAAGIVPGVDRYVVMPSAQAEVFGVGITPVAGSMLVSPSWETSCGIVPGGRLGGISGVESGNAAPLVGGPPGTELQTVVEELPSGAVGEMLPVAEVTNGVGIVPNAVVDGIAFGDIVGVSVVVVAALPGMDVGAVLNTVDGAGTGIAAIEGEGSGGGAGGCGAGKVVPGKSVMNDVAGCADSESVGATVVETAGAADVGGVAVGVAAVVPATDAKETTGTAGVPGVICPDGVAQVTTVPGVVGFDASGTGASVVSGAPGWVVTENGLGPLSGEDWITPGVDGRPMAVVPIVETCARHT